MKYSKGSLALSATDLAAHLSCEHLTALDVQVAAGALPKPDHYDPLLELLRERGKRHEQAYLDHLKEAGHSIVMIDGVDITDDAVAATQAAMQSGETIIAQAALRDGCWSGRADILRRVDASSRLGDYSYEVLDTKLARETKGGTVLQLCLYADLVMAVQGTTPEFIHVVPPWADFLPQTFRFADYAAYYRRVKTAAEAAAAEGAAADTYPDPKSHCEICRWQRQCDQRRRDDDHLCLVAGISKNQINELQAHGFGTTEALAAMPSHVPFTPQRGSPVSLEKTRAQAAIQIKARHSGEPEFELLDVEVGFGLAALPEPSPGDVFFDLESDPFVGEHGIEYLFGYVYADPNGSMQRVADWALDRESEKACFERFIDFATTRREACPSMHIYHFGPFDVSALKRLMGRYASREDEVDNLLRGLAFVDLLSVTRNAIRAGVESYSLKQLEPFFGYQRQLALHEANVALTKVSVGLELNDVPSIDEATKQAVATYNADDCLAAAGLRDWLEERRSDLVGQGHEVPRPAPAPDDVNEELDEQQQRVQELIGRLTHDVPIDPEARTAEQQARWILAYVLDWHRRETKAVWWEYFRLRDLSADELINEKPAIARLELVGTVDQTKTGIPIHRYSFDHQDTDLRGDENLYGVGGERIGTAVAVAPDQRTIDIKKMKATADIHPEAVFAHKYIDPKEQAASLVRLGEYVADNGIEGDGPHKAARALLLREPINIGEQVFQADGEEALAAALRLASLINVGVLPIQGPPGTGKSFTGARMICTLVKQGKRVGITANSHKVIRNLIDKVIEAAPEMKAEVKCVQKPESDNTEDDGPTLIFAKSNDQVLGALAAGDSQVAGATSFFWAREDAQDVVDVLVVDEAGQMSLANVLAVAQAGKIVVLLGDPQQLEQPNKGTHPDGTGVSALDHLLEGRPTITPEQGLFLGTSYRLHPDICAFNSELFYEGKLDSVEGCTQQRVTADVSIAGSGLRYVPVQHSGNTSASFEEANVVRLLVERILASDAKWTDRAGVCAPVTADDILITAPYNAQVFEIKRLLPAARVGTVDKFQGQEAPIVIYSMATSSHADAPRGMEFLYSANRLNVAISRAKCMAILIGSPGVFQADCKTPRQMQLANAFCRYLERCEVVQIQATGE